MNTGSFQNFMGTNNIVFYDESKAAKRYDKERLKREIDVVVPLNQKERRCASSHLLKYRGESGADYNPIQEDSQQDATAEIVENKSSVNGDA